MKKRVAIMISGRGSNMMSLVNAAKDPNYPASIELVLSNNLAPGLAFAHSHGIETIWATHKGMKREDHEMLLHGELLKANIDIVCLAGYMRILTPTLVNLWKGRMLNIHPSLLPAFTGLHTHERAFLSNVKYHGCTVHVVTEELDWGPIIDQALVNVTDDDSANTLEKKVLEQEHILYPKALRKFIEQGNWSC